MIDRRELIHRAAMILGGAVSSSAMAGVLGGCAVLPRTADKDPPPAPRFLTVAELAAVSALAEQIIPRTDTPGAVDVGVPMFVDRMMADFYREPEQTALRSGLSRADAEAQIAHGKPFANLAPEQQIALMTIWDEEAAFRRKLPEGVVNDPHFFRTMKELTTLGFFTSETGASKYLRYDPIPGPWRADIPYADIGRAWAV
jgi:gluconate 2-dehydrogenase gamma chain